MKEISKVKKEKVNIAVIGIGNIGRKHISLIRDEELTELVAICDKDKSKTKDLSKEYDTKPYNNHLRMFEDLDIDGVLISTPHSEHPSIAIDAFHNNIHVLMEKPIAVNTKDARAMLCEFNFAKRKYADLVFGVMFQQRTYDRWRRIKGILSRNELGKLIRITWIMTDWFRTQEYYDRSSWKGTWLGEGGALLINQCPHNLDIVQWFVGLPRKIIGRVALGKYHRIEAEDEISAIMEFRNGLIVHFISSTSEMAGSDYLEIVGDCGKIVYQYDSATKKKELLQYFYNCSTIEAIEKGIEKHNPNVRRKKIQLKGQNESSHAVVIKNFAEAILHDKELIAPGFEGLNSLLMSNGILLSSYKEQPVDIPFSDDEYIEMMNHLLGT